MSKEEKMAKAILYSMKLEEEEAIRNDPESDADRFLKLTSDIRSIIMSPKSNNKSDPENQINLAIKLVELKQLNRFEKLRTQHIREKVNKMKRRVDTFFLQLQNLRHEEMYIQKEAKRCLDYKSKVDEADLVSLEEFFQSQRFASIDEEIAQDEHRLTLARLEWELEQRINLAKEVAESSVLTLEPKRQIISTQGTLGRLRQSMSSVIDALIPLSQELNSVASHNEMEKDLSDDDGCDDIELIAKADDAEASDSNRQRNSSHKAMEVDE